MLSTSFSRFVSRAASTTLIATVIFAGLLGTAEARRPNSASSTGLIAPASAGIGQTFAVSGSGYDPAKQTWVLEETASGRGYWLASVDSQGTMSLDLAISEAGAAKLTAQQTSGGKTQTMGTATVNIN